MPKDNTHWLLALEARKSLVKGELKKLLQKNEEAYLAGAVLPDSLFMPVKLEHYYRERIHFFHGRDNRDTFAFLRIADRNGWLDEPWKRAFLLGMVSHIVSDAHFHPMVYYFCGWPSHENRPIAHNSLALHYRLEALMDFFYLRRFNLTIHSYYLKDILQKLPIHQLAEICGLINFPDKPLEPMVMEKMILTHGRYQRLCSRKRYRLLTYPLKLMGIHLNHSVDLVYRSPRRILHNKRFEYRHCVTGRKEQICWNDMFDRAAEIGGETMMKLFTLMEADKLHEMSAGPNLETGLSAHMEEQGKVYCQPCSPYELFSR